MTDNVESTITLIIDSNNKGDVSFRDAESANIFLNVHKTLFQDEDTQHIVDFSKEDEREWWEDYLSGKEEFEITHTLCFNQETEETEAVVEILEGLYNVEIIYI
jgi:hypothetical protein